MVNKMIESLIPENDLENLLIKVQERQVEFGDFIKYFLEADLFVPSGTEVMPDGSGMAPLLFEKNGVQMLGVFTAISRVKLFKDMTPYCLSMKGRELLARMPSGCGLVVNPGFDKGFELPPSGLKEILRTRVKMSE